MINSRINSNVSSIDLVGANNSGSNSNNSYNSSNIRPANHIIPAKQEVEMVCFDDVEGGSVGNIDMIQRINDYLEAERAINAKNIEKLTNEKDRLQEMYEQFLIPAKEDADKLKFAASFMSDPYSWQPTEEMIVAPTYDLYIQKHQEEFKEFMGMSLEEYNLIIQDLNNSITYLEAYDYNLRQKAKEMPYLEIEVSDEYQTYLSNLKEEPQTPKIPRDYLSAKNNTTLDGYQINTIDNTKYDIALSNFNYLNQEQTNMYNYLFDTKGEDAALAYLLAIEDSLNQARGQAEANEFLQSIANEEGAYDVNFDTFFKTTSKGLGSGVETFFEGFENLMDFTGDGVKTENQYAQMFILQELQKSGELDDKFLSGTFEVSNSIGNMLPTVVVSMLVDSAAKGVKVGDKTPGEIIGNLLMGMSAAGNAKNDALISGSSKGQAYVYGILNGASEAVIGEMMGNIPGLNSEAKFSLLKILQEGGEEFIQEYIDTGLRAAILGESIEITELNSQALKSFLYGCISSGVMTGGQTVINISIGGTRYTIDNINELINLCNNPKTNNNSNNNDDISSTSEININDKIARYKELLEIIKSEGFQKYQSKKDAYINNLSYGEKGEMYEGVKSEITQLRDDLLSLEKAGLVTATPLGRDSYNFKLAENQTNNNTSNSTSVDVGSDVTFKKLVSKLGNAGAQKAVWFFAYGTGEKKLELIPQEFHEEMRKISDEEAERFLETNISIIRYNKNNTSSVTNNESVTRFNNSTQYENSEQIKNEFTSDLNLSKKQQEELLIYSRLSGPIIGAFLRKSDCKFFTRDGRNDVYFGGDPYKIQEAYNKAREQVLKKKSQRRIELAIRAIDLAIKRSQPLRKDTILYRGTNALYYEGTQLDVSNLKVGDLITDNAYTSTSLLKEAAYGHNDIMLEILAPVGTKGIYMESYANSTQQEFLLGRNSTFKIISGPETNKTTGKTTIRVEIVNQDQCYSNKYNILDKFQLNGSVDCDAVNSYNDLFNKFSSIVDVNTFINKLKYRGLISVFNSKIQDMDLLYSLGEVGVIDHGIDHVQRVMLYAMYMGSELQLDQTDMNILIDAAKYHDIGVHSGHSNHGRISARDAIENLPNNYSKDQKNKIAAIIEYHEAVDNENTFNEILSKYNIPSSEYQSVLQIASILKDADALDRTRFRNNLNPKYFRNKDVANSLIKTSYQIQEIRGGIELRNKIAANIYTQEQLEQIKYFQSRGVPDFVIEHSFSTYDKWGQNGVRLFETPFEMIKSWLRLK